ncbi:helix-turn-helix domain-containing protein [Rhodospirillum sp. A1_3_36]|uniref:helix-turn-helix domain-containing protein n=1 Tax=Rhodospirillum sp. A1_3_36 TaxID=3391666 RepID=UPI0039A49D7B
MAKRKNGRCTEIDVAIGQRIRTLRRVRGITQTKLDEALGVSFQQIQKYEKGVNTLGPSQLVRLSSYFDVPVSRLFDGMEIDIDGNVVARTETENDLHERVLEVAFRMNAVPDGGVRDRLLDLVGSMAAALAGDLALVRRRGNPPPQ